MSNVIVEYVDYHYQYHFLISFSWNMIARKPFCLISLLFVWKPGREKNDWSRHRIKTICGEIQQKTLIHLKFFKIFEACLAIYHQWVSIHLLGDGFFLIFMTNFHIERNHVKNKPNSRKSNGSYSVRSSKTLFLDKKRAWLDNMVESSKYLNWYLNV